MRTMLIILGGYALLGLWVVASRIIGEGSNQAMLRSAQLFIPVWLAGALLNMWVGVARAGYPVAEELPIILLIFALPAAAAGLIWWKLS
jgi:hypothetical protein